MTFGKRQSGPGAAAQALNSGSTFARTEAALENARATGSPIRWLLVVIACSVGLYTLFASYAPDILRDHRLAGTWQPAYDLQATEGKCKRTNFVVTFCTAKIHSVARPDQAPIDHSFYMLFSGGGGEALVPVRSTADRTAVSIAYTAEAKLWNRTLSFILSVIMLALMDAVAALLLWKSVN